MIILELCQICLALLIVNGNNNGETLERERRSCDVDELKPITKEPKVDCRSFSFSIVYIIVSLLRIDTKHLRLCLLYFQWSLEFH
jgi:hypothetical protein